jgi:hypothetical protein
MGQVIPVYMASRPRRYYSPYGACTRVCYFQEVKYKKCLWFPGKSCLDETDKKVTSLYLPLNGFICSSFYYFFLKEEAAFIKIYTSAKLIRHHLLSSKSPLHPLRLSNLLPAIIPPGAE